MVKLLLKPCRRIWAVGVMLAAVGGCAPKNASVRTPGDVEVAIRHAADVQAGSVDMIADKMAESLAAWRARCVAEAAGRAGRVHVTIEVEKGEFAARLEELTLPAAAGFKAAEQNLLAAAGLTMADNADKNAVTVEIVLKTSCAAGCKAEAQIKANRMPEWHGAWNLVLTDEFPASPDKK